MDNAHVQPLLPTLTYISQVAKVIEKFPTGMSRPQGINDRAIHPAALGRDSLPVLRAAHPKTESSRLRPGLLNPLMRKSLIGTHSFGRVHHQQLSNLDKLSAALDVSKCRDVQSITRTSPINPMKHLQETKSLAAAETGVHS